MVNPSPYPCHRVRFGLFEADLHTGELWRSGRRLKLTGQPFSVLAMLLERPGEVISREEVQRRLWPDTFVDVDHNLNTAINKIRQVLSDSAERPRFVETLSRRGYRFIAPVETDIPETVAQSTGHNAPSLGRERNSERNGAEHGFWLAVLPLKLSFAICRQVGRRASGGQGSRGTLCTRRQPSSHRRQGTAGSATGGMCIGSSSLGGDL